MSHRRSEVAIRLLPLLIKVLYRPLDSYLVRNALLWPVKVINYRFPVFVRELSECSNAMRTPHTSLCAPASAYGMAPQLPQRSCLGHSVTTWKSRQRTFYSEMCIISLSVKLRNTSSRGRSTQLWFLWPLPLERSADPGGPEAWGLGHVPLLTARFRSGRDSTTRIT